MNWIDFTYDRTKESEEEDTVHGAAVTMELQGIKDQKIRNIRCEGNNTFKSFKCQLIIPSLNFGDALTNLLGDESLTKEIMAEESIAQKILNTGVKNFLLEFETASETKIT